MVTPSGIELEIGPPYHFARALEVSDQRIYEIAAGAGRKVLRDPHNIFDIRYDFTGIPCDAGFVPRDFRTAIPDTVFGDYSIGVDQTTARGHHDIRLSMTDAMQPKRTINLVEQEPRGKLGGDFSVDDNYPHRERPSEPSISRSAVRSFLIQQAFESNNPTWEILKDEKDLCFELGRKATRFVRLTQTGETHYSETEILHVEEKVIRPATPANAAPCAVSMSVWLTGRLVSRERADDLLVRTVARFDALHPENPKNSIKYEVHAALAHDPTSLTTAAKLTSDERITRVSEFVSSLHSYIVGPTS